MNRLFFNRLHYYKYRKKLREQATPAEKHLWYHIKGRKLNNFKFRRQSSLGKYIVDFYCPAKNLIIELDGEHHFNPVNEEKDIKRDIYLEKRGFKVLRFRNDQVFKDIEGVKQIIAQHLE